MPRACVAGQSPSQGWGEERWSDDFWPTRLSLSQCGHVFVSSVRYNSKLIGHLDRGS